MSTRCVPASVRRIARYRPNDFTLLASIALLGVVLVLIRLTAHGVGLHWDSINYISVARHLLDGDGFVEFSVPADAPWQLRQAGDPYTRWPPLYPMLLAAATFLAFDPYVVAGPVNAAIFGLTVFVAGQWLRRRLESRSLALWASLGLAFSIPLVEMAAWALSESLFILLATLALVWTDKFMGDGTRASLIGAAVFTALACLTRYMGVAVTGAAVLLLVFQPGVAPLAKAKRIVLYSLIALAPIAWWMLRNFLLVGAFTGDRENYTHYSLPEILYGMLVVVSQKWLFIDLVWGITGSLVLALTGIFLLALATAVGYLLIRSLWDSSGRIGWRLFIVSGVFGAAYLTALVLAMTQGNTTHGVQARFLAPAYIPLFCAGVCALDQLLRYCNGRVDADRPRFRLAALRIFVRGGVLRILTTALAATLCLGLAYYMVLYVSKTPPTAYQGYNTSKWFNSETLAYLRETRPDSIITNAVAATYFYSGGQAEHRILSLDRQGLKEQLLHAPDGSYVVWFFDRNSNWDFDYGHLATRMGHGLEPVAELRDGAVFKVNRAYR